MEIPARSYTNTEYRYGFNGMERDDEVKGSGNSYTTHFRQYDPRLGRWKSLDPKKEKYPSMSPYSYSANNPVWYVDKQGDTLTRYYNVIAVDGTKIVVKAIDKNYVKKKNVVRSYENTNWLIAGALEVAFDPNNEYNGYLEKDVKHNVTEIYKVQEVQNADGTFSLEQPVLESSVDSEFKKPIKGHWLDGAPGVTFEGSGPFDFGTKRRSSSIKDVTDVIDIAKYIVGTAGPVGKGDFSIDPKSLSGALTLDDKGSTGAIDDSEDILGSKKNGVDTLKYEGEYGSGEFIVKNGSDTIKHRPSGSNTYYDYSDKTGD